MDEAKIRLSPRERELLYNTEWILTKNSILEKVKQLLGSIQENYRARLANLPGLPDVVRRSSPKISKGENYRGLPYLVLDYPRHFIRDEIFAVRTFFWWGNFFSITLQLSGMLKKNAERKIIDAFSILSSQDYFICISDDPWQHHFEKENYVPVSGMGRLEFEKRITQSSFLKLAARTELQYWDECEQIFSGYFDQLIGMAIP